MSMDPRDRVLEYALERLLGENAEEPDLAPRIVEAFARGEERELPALPPAPTAATGVRRSRPRLLPRTALRWTWLAAAAAIASLSLFLWRSNRAPAPPETLARAETPVLLLRGPGYTAAFASEIVSGDRVVVPLGDEVSFHLRGGASLVAGGGTLFRIGAPTPRGSDGSPGAMSLDLLVGNLRFATDSPGDLHVETGIAHLRPASGALFAVMVELDPGGMPGRGWTDPNVAAKLFRTGLDMPRLLTVSVKRGSLEWVLDDQRETLWAGDLRRAWSGEPATELLTEDVEKKVAGLLSEIGGAGVSAKQPSLFARNVSPALAKPAEALSSMLARQPQYWKLVASTAIDWAKDPRERARVIGALVEFLVRDDSPTAYDLARELWLYRPEAFDEHQIVAFAERGAFEFERELAAILEQWRPGDGGAPVLSAAWLCRHGDPGAIEVLEAVLAEADDAPDAAQSRLLAAYALGTIGDQKAWEDNLKRTEETAEQLLAAKEPAAAGVLALLADHLDGLRQREEPSPLGTLPRDLDVLLRERGPKLSSPEWIRAVFAGLHR